MQAAAIVLCCPPEHDGKTVDTMSQSWTNQVGIDVEASSTGWIPKCPLKRDTIQAIGDGERNAINNRLQFYLPVIMLAAVMTTLA
jgi:hypothetical protein